MDPSDEATLTAMSKTGVVPNSESERERLDRLVKEGYMYREERGPALPGAPTAAPIYRLTVRGRAFVENRKRGPAPKGE